MTDPLVNLFEEWVRADHVGVDFNSAMERRLSGQFLHALQRQVLESLAAAGADVARPTRVPDLLASRRETGSVPLAVEFTVWSRSRKNLRNRVTEAVATAVATRRAVQGEIVLDLLLAVTPMSDQSTGDEQTILEVALGLLRQDDGVGYDSVYVGFAGPESRWFRVGGDTQPTAIDEVLAHLRLDLHNRSTLLKPAAPPVPVALLVADEWGSSLGGISTLNRTLAIGLSQNGFDVHVLLPTFEPADEIEASDQGIAFHLPNPVPGIEDAAALLSPATYPSGFAPDLIVGHGRVLGPYAFAVQKNQFPQARRWHIVHTDSETLEAIKTSGESGARMRLASERRNLEIDLARSAELVSGVGPVLNSSIDRSLRGSIPRPSTFELVPALKDWGALAPPIKSPGAHEILILGRADDYHLKGLDIGARAVAIADGTLRHDRPNHSANLVVRGASEAEEEHLRRRLQRLLGSKPVILRPFSTIESELRTDFFAASTVLLPSRHEGFGLSGYEAIAAGVPVLVSEESGLGQLIYRVDPSAPEVLATTADPDRDIDRWADAIVRNVRDPTAAFKRARVLRAKLAKMHSWSRVAFDLRAQL